MGSSLIVFVLVVLVAPWIGTSGISIRNVVAGVYPDREIFFIARLPRVVLGAFTGGALAIAGVLFQAILRNSLACPFTLRVSTGSSLGAVVIIWLGLNLAFLGIPLITVAAFASALMTIVLVFFIAQSDSALPTFTLLLAGVTLNFVFDAVILIIFYTANVQQSFTMIHWMMGSLADAADLGSTLRVALLIFATLVALLWLSPRLNALATGEEWAASRGIDIERLKKIAYFSGSILTGAVTAFSGPIGFVGLIVPHTLRLIVGPDHRLLIPSSFFLGGAFLVVCDTFARTILAPTEIPVGVVTALLGGPFFIILLKRKQNGLW